MTPGQVSPRIVTSRLELLGQLLSQIRALPLDDVGSFMADSRNIGAAESYLRRSLEALLDIGRHLLAKGFGEAASEYKKIASKLREQDVLTEVEVEILYNLAGYRNRMVHFYHEVSAEELYGICTNELDDLEKIADAYRRWMSQNPEKVEQA